MKDPIASILAEAAVPANLVDRHAGKRSRVLEFPKQLMEFRALARRIQPAEGLLRDDWDRHHNGGGWVQKSALVSPTAYVGPRAIVSGEARVLDYVQLIDEASVTDLALIAGKAVIGGTVTVGGNAKIFGVARVLGDAQVGGVFSMSIGEIRSGVSRPLGRSRQLARRPEAQMQLSV